MSAEHAGPEYHAAVLVALHNWRCAIDTVREAMAGLHQAEADLYALAGGPELSGAELLAMAVATSSAAGAPSSAAGVAAPNAPNVTSAAAPIGEAPAGTVNVPLTRVPGGIGEGLVPQLVLRHLLEQKKLGTE